MKLSTKGRYALIAMAYIARKDFSSKVSVTEISNKLEKEYSEQLNNKEKQIAEISNKLAGKNSNQINKPEPTPKEIKKLQEERRLLKKKKMNYIVRGDDGIWTFYLNVYKTAKFFDFKRFNEK